MKTLMLLRHAKSSWDDPDLADIDRPLAQRGRKAAPKMAAFMKKQGWSPALVLVSPAKRAQQTWAAMAESFPDATVVTVDAIYPGEPHALAGVLADVAGDVPSVMMIGHNPGLETYAEQLARRSSNGTLDRLLAKFPTAALAVYQIEDNLDWPTAATHGGKLVAFVRPRELDDR